MSFGFQNFEHAFAWAAQEIVRGARAITTVLTHLQASEPVVEGLTSLVAPQAVEIERGAFAILGMAIKAIQDAGAAAQANGVNVQLDAQTVADVRAIIPAVHAQLSGAGGIPPQPAVAAKAP